MVKSHLNRHLVAIFVCCAILTIHSDGANLYGPPRQLDIERHLDTPDHEDTFTLERLSDLTGGTAGGSSSGWDEVERGHEANALNSNTFSNSNGLRTNFQQTIGRPPPSSYVPGRYFMLPPEENFLQQLLRHSASLETRGSYEPRETGTVYGFTFPRNIAERLELKLPAVDNARSIDWAYAENTPQDAKPKRFYPQLSQNLQDGQTQPHYAQRTEGALQEPRVATKRWWGGYHRQRGQMDRRASQSKHYDCLKSCIKEGKLHPIQCHTLC